MQVTAGTEPGVNLVTVLVRSQPGATCSLRVSVARRAVSHMSRVVGASGGARWEWAAPARAAPGPWTLLATCRAGGFWAWHRSIFEMGFPRRGGALVGLPGESAAVVGVGAQSCDSQYVCFTGDPFPVGQCTWYAQGRRPDLLAIVHGDAWEWLGAARGHVPEGSRPQAGAIAVWMPGRGPAGPLGHVAYVAAVSGPTVLLDDSNWRPTASSSGLQVHEHWLPASSPSGYIYGGPAGGGP